MEFYSYRAKALFLLLFSLLLISCNDSEDSFNLLKQSQSIVESNPAQAYILLDSIRHAELDTESYMQYLVTRVQAKYKTNQDITTDTIIFIAQQYFENGNNPEKKALANYYSAAVYDEKKIVDKALICYLSAERYARQANNCLIAGRSLHSIAYIYYVQGLMDSTIVRLEQAMECYNQTDGAELNKLQAITLIGSAYKNTNQLDSAYFYFNLGLELAANLENNEYQGLLMNNLGVVFLDQGDYEKSISYFHQALVPKSSTEDSLRVYLSLSTVYNSCDQLDSANYYTNLLKERLSEITDSYIPRSIYEALSDYNVKIGNYQEAYYYTQLQKDFERKIAEQDIANKLIETEHIYQLGIKEKEIEAIQARFFLFLIIGGLLISMIMCVCYFRAKNMRLKNEQEKEKNRLLQIQYDMKANSLMFLQNIYSKIASQWLAIEKEVDKLTEEYGAKEKPTIYTRIKDIIENIKDITNLQLIEWAKEYLEKETDTLNAIIYLNDTELLLVGLLCNNYTKAEIGSILKISANKIHPMKLAIKHKLKKAGLSDNQIEEIMFSNTK